jgi:hypothetical protein
MEGKDALPDVLFVRFVTLKLCACAAAEDIAKAMQEIVAVLTTRRNPLTQFDISPP